jgi:hypothetical protein
MAWTNFSTVHHSEEQRWNTVICSMWWKTDETKNYAQHREGKFESTLFKWFRYGTSAALLVHGSTTKAKAIYLTAYFKTENFQCSKGGFIASKQEKSTSIHKA